MADEKYMWIGVPVDIEDENDIDPKTIVCEGNQDGPLNFRREAPEISNKRKLLQEIVKDSGSEKELPGNLEIRSMSNISLIHTHASPG